MRLCSITAFAALTLATTAAPAAAQAPGRTPRHLLMVVAKQQPGMALYDAETDTLHCKSANLGVAPHEGEFSPDGRMAYVPTYGSSAVGQPGTDEHVISFIRTSDCQTVFTLDTGDYKRPHHVQVGKSGLVYVTAELKESVLVIDPGKRAIVGTIPTGSNTTHMIALTPDEKTIYASNVMAKTVTVLDVAGKAVTRTIPTTSNNQRMALSPDGRWFVTHLGPERKVAFFRRADGELDFTVDVSGSPFTGQFSADGKWFYVMGAAPPAPGQAPGGPPAARPPAAPGAPVGGTLRAWKIDVASRSVAATIAENLGSGAGSLAVNPVNGRVYMSAMAHDLVSIIDPASWTVVKTIASEDNPDGLFFATVK